MEYVYKISSYMKFDISMALTFINCKIMSARSCFYTVFLSGAIKHVSMLLIKISRSVEFGNSTINQSIQINVWNFISLACQIFCPLNGFNVTVYFNTIHQYQPVVNLFSFKQCWFYHIIPISCTNRSTWKAFLPYMSA